MIKFFKEIIELFYFKPAVSQLKPNISWKTVCVGFVTAIVGMGLMLVYFINVKPSFIIHVETSHPGFRVVYNTGNDKDCSISSKGRILNSSIPWNRVHKVFIEFDSHNLAQRQIILKKFVIKLPDDERAPGFIHFYIDKENLEQLKPLKDVNSIKTAKGLPVIITDGPNPSLKINKKNSLLAPILEKFNLPDIPSSGVLGLLGWFIFSFVAAFYLKLPKDFNLLVFNFPEKQTWQHKLTFVVAYHVLFFIFLLCFLPVLGFTISLPMSQIYPFAAFIISSVVVFFALGVDEIKLFTISLLICFLLIALSIIIAIPFEEIVHDAARNHQPCAMFLAKNFNPIWQPHVTHIKDSGLEIPFFQFNLWLTKASYIISATMMKLTNQYSAGSFYHSLLAIVSFLVAMVALPREKFPLGYRLIIAVASAGNPIVFGELFSMGPDGVVASLLTIYSFALLGYSYKKDRSFIPIILFSGSLAINIKNNIVAYIVLIALPLFLYLLLNISYKKLARRHIATAIFLIFFSGFIGVNPFLSNISLFNNPLYFLVGSKSGTPEVKKTRGHTVYASNPGLVRVMDKMNNLELFAYTQLLSGQVKGHPGRINLNFRETFNNYPHYQPMICGFGSIFKISFLAALILLPFIIKAQNRKILLLILGILISVAIMPNTYQARYIPQAWLLPVFIGIASFSNSQKEKRLRVSEVTGIFINSSLIIGFLIQLPSITCDLIQNNLKYEQYLGVPANRFYMFPSKTMKCPLFGIKNGPGKRFMNKAVPVSYSLDSLIKDKTDKNIYYKKIFYKMWILCFAEYNIVNEKDFCKTLSGHDYLVIADNRFGIKGQYPEALKKYSRMNKTSKGAYAWGNYLIIHKGKILKQLLNPTCSYKSFRPERMLFKGKSGNLPVNIKVRAARHFAGIYFPPAVYINSHQTLISNLGLNLICIKNNKIYCYSPLDSNRLLEATLPLNFSK